MNNKTYKKEFGDFQTPPSLAQEVCKKLVELSITADTIIEPTCGKGAFVLAALQYFSPTTIKGFEINPDYLALLDQELNQISNHKTKISTKQADFFANNWQEVFANSPGELLILGNYPWTTNSTLGRLNSDNLPPKANFHHHKGLEAITGRGNFDISEYMLINNLHHLQGRKATIAMLVKTAVARKVISYIEQNQLPLYQASIYKIDAKAQFQVAVDACLLILELDPEQVANYDYKIYDSLKSSEPTIVGQRNGLTISNLQDYEDYKHLLKDPNYKAQTKEARVWRSGIKHDASAIMEFTKVDNSLVNGLKEKIPFNSKLFYPLYKGSDIGSKKAWNNKYLLLTQHKPKADTSYLEQEEPEVWNYLIQHSTKLDNRKSAIHRKNSRFGIFGVGDYSFKKWKIAICSLYKHLNFILLPPINGKPAMVDDTVYFLSFDSQAEAEEVLAYLKTEQVQKILNALIFWDDKRAIKTSILNLLDLNPEKIQAYQLLNKS